MSALTYAALSPEVQRYIDPSIYASFFTSPRNKSVRNKKPKKGVMFSNYSRPGNNINNSLPKSMISATSNKTFGSSVVPPTSVGNTYSHVNYNRRPQGGQRKRKTRKTKRRNTK